LRQIGLCGSHGGLRLSKIEGSGDVAVETHLDQLERVLLTVERILGNLPQLLIGEQG